MTLVITTRRIILGVLAFAVFYTGLVQVQMFLTRRNARVSSFEDPGESPHKVYAFSFSKFTPAGEKEIEIEGDSADILARTVMLTNVMAKVYADETPVTVTADQGHYDKAANMVHLEKNVVATTDNGTRLMTRTLDIQPSKRMMETEAPVEVKKDNIQVEGVGARGHSNLKKVKFYKTVTVVIQDTQEKEKGATVVTCDGPLLIDYDKNIAHFQKNVVAEDSRGHLSADTMDVYYNRETRMVSKMVAVGNVVIHNPDGNQTLSDHVVYLAEEGRFIIGGDAEALYVKGNAFEPDMFQ